MRLQSFRNYLTFILASGSIIACQPTHRKVDQFPAFRAKPDAAYNQALLQQSERAEVDAGRLGEIGIAASEGSCSRAEQALHKLKKTFILHDYAHYLVGKCYEESKKWKIAAEHFEAALRLMPAKSRLNRLVRPHYGKSLYHLGKLDEARMAIHSIKVPRIYTVKEASRYLFIGDIYTKLQEADRAEELYHNLYFQVLGREQMQAIRQFFAGRIDVPLSLETSELKLMAANAYKRGGKSEQAAQLYRKLLQEQETKELLVQLRFVYKRMKAYEMEEKVLKRLVRQSSDRSARQRAYRQLGRFYWNRGRDNKAVKAWQVGLSLAPRSEESIWILYYLGRLHEAQKKYERAQSYLRKMGALRTNDARTQEIQMVGGVRAGWLYYKQERYSEASKVFTRLINKYEDQPAEDDARFWLASSVLRLGHEERSKQQFADLAEKWPYSYYGLLAIKRARPTSGFVSYEGDRAGSSTSSAKLSAEDKLHLHRAHMMFRLGYLEDGREELNSIRWQGKSRSMLLELARHFADGKDYYRTMLLTRLAVNYQEDAVEQKHLPWLYPLAYWKQVESHASKNGVDPYLLLSIMRQESAFDPMARSIADAFGIAQILPQLANQVSSKLGMGPVHPDQLYDPDLSIKISAFHVGQLLSKYRNNLIYAIAAYNAGPTAVQDWMNRFEGLTPTEFIEEIPYGETKKYVKLVLRNYAIYARLYAEDKHLNMLP